MEEFRQYVFKMCDYTKSDNHIEQDISIKDKLELLCTLIDKYTREYDKMSPMSRRLSIFSIMVEALLLLVKLKQKVKEIDVRLSEEVAELDLEKWCNSEILKTFPNDDLWDELKCSNVLKDVLSTLILELPPAEQDQILNSKNLGPFVGSISNLCYEESVSSLTIILTLNHIFFSLRHQLSELYKKTKTIDAKLFRDYWNSLLEKYISDEAAKDYEKWQKTYDNLEFDRLKDKRAQELLELLSTGMFDYTKTPNQRDVSNNKIVISPESLEYGTKLSDDIKLRCTRFSEFVEVKNDIFCIKDDKLGEYLFKNSWRINDDSKKKLFYFNTILNYIQADMAKFRPNLTKHLVKNEKEIIDNIKRESYKVLLTCEDLLSPGLDNNALESIFERVLNSNIKDELIEKLSRSARYKVLCSFIAAIKNKGGIFETNTTFIDIAHKLSKEIKRPIPDSLERYMEGAAKDRDPIYEKTTEIVSLYINEIKTKAIKDTQSN